MQGIQWFYHIWPTMTMKGNCKVAWVYMGLIPWKRCMLGPWIALAVDSKQYTGNPMVLSYLTFDDLGRSLQGHVYLNGPIPLKRCVLGPWIVLTADTKTICRESNGAIRFDLRCPGKVISRPRRSIWAYSMETMHVRPSDCIDSRY